MTPEEMDQAVEQASKGAANYRPPGK